MFLGYLKTPHYVDGSGFAYGRHHVVHVRWIMVKRTATITRATTAIGGVATYPVEDQFSSVHVWSVGSSVQYILSKVSIGTFMPAGIFT